MQLSHTIYVHGAISSIHIFTLPCMNLVVIEVRNFILVLYVIEKNEASALSYLLSLLDDLKNNVG